MGNNPYTNSGLKSKKKYDLDETLTNKPNEQKKLSLIEKINNSSNSLIIEKIRELKIKLDIIEKHISNCEKLEITEIGQFISARKKLKGKISDILFNQNKQEKEPYKHINLVV